MKNNYIGTVASKITGREYFVVRSMRCKYFDLVPLDHPAQTLIRFDRRDFTEVKK